MSVTAELPFPIDLDLPSGWIQVPPAAAGEPDAGFVAIRAASENSPVPTSLVISGLTLHANQVNLRALAETHIERLSARLHVRVLNREDSPDGVQVAQLLRIDGGPVPLNQIQVLIAFPDNVNSSASGVVQIMLSCPVNVFSEAGPEFRRIVGSIRLADAPLPSKD